MLKPKEAATMLGLSCSTVYDLFRSGKLRGYRFAKKAIRFDERDVQEFKQLCQSTTTAATSATASSSAVSLRASDTELAAFFRGRGVKPKLTPTTSKKAGACTPLRLVSESVTP